MTVAEVVSRDEEFRYRLLSRLQSDCKYYVDQSRASKHLWAGSEAEQIEYMKAIWNSLPEKPEWLSYEEIENYEKQMGA